MKSSHFNTISFHGVIGNILTLRVRAPGSNPGGGTKLRQLETDLDESIIVTKIEI